MRKLFVLGLLCTFLLTACAGDGQASSLESRQIDDLEARISALEGQIAALSAASEDGHDAEASEAKAGAFEVALAQYVMDTAGFHAMDEALNETQTVDPAYLSTVNRVRQVSAQTPWPEELHEQAGAFVAVLDEFAVALDADNAAEAAVLAAELHEVQHDFSHAIDGWLGTGDSGHGD